MAERLTPFWKVIVAVFTIIATLLSINQLFFLRLFGFNPIVEGYLYYLLACLLPLTFIVFPAKPGQRIQWYDALCFLVSLVVPLYLAGNAQRIVLEGWERVAPTFPTVGSVLLWVVLLEGVRRAGGSVLAVFCLVFSVFPLFTGYMPIGVLRGIEYSFLETARSHIMSSSSILGAPMNAFGTLLIGFLLFGAILVHTGGGNFFFDLAQSLFGRTRGGAAKVGVVGSAFFGMLSGSAVSNVVTTGSMTIPAMKRSGFAKEYAGAIEAVASTGGTITPPIMGSAAFIMAAFLATPYAEIAVASAIPAFLYFFALFVQVDGYAALQNLRGLPSSELPRFVPTLKRGWIFVVSIVVMTYWLLVTHNEAQAPYYACILLILGSFLNPETRLNLQKVWNLIIDTGKLLAEMTAILAGVGFIVGALSITGVSFSFSRELVAAAGDNGLLILLAGALTSFILGMGMTISAAYIFLALVMGPALIRLGFDPIAAHLFILFWAKVSYITPPVALATYAAAGIAGADPLKTGWIGIRLGIVSYIVPFFMVYNPALITHGEPLEVAIAFGFAVLGSWWLASALEGYLWGVGELRNPLLRALVGICGFFVFFPEVITSVVGSLIMLVVFIWAFIRGRQIPRHAGVG